MGLKEQLREKALELGFEDAGFTGIEPLDLYIKEIESRPKEMYQWVQKLTARDYRLGTGSTFFPDYGLCVGYPLSPS